MDSCEAYDPTLIALAMRCALEQKVPLHRGVLYFHCGPQYETSAEVEQMRRSGGDILTMSTVYEVIAARHMARRVLVISNVVNMAAGVLPTPLCSKKSMIMSCIENLLRMAESSADNIDRAFAVVSRLG